MSQLELLKRIAASLDRCGAPYMLTGSFASGLHGSPRATHDVDFVVELTAPQIRTLISELPPPRFYCDADAAIATATSGQPDAMFNLIDTQSGDKADLWIVSDDAFDQSRFARRQACEFEGALLYVSSPEDTILMKLRWSARSGGSLKHTSDARAVYEVMRASIDEAYLDRWAARLGLAPDLASLRDQASRG